MTNPRTIYEIVDASKELPDNGEVVCIRGDGGGAYFYKSGDVHDVLKEIEISKGEIKCPVHFLRKKEEMYVFSREELGRFSQWLTENQWEYYAKGNVWINAYWKDKKPVSLTWEQLLEEFLIDNP